MSTLKEIQKLEINIRLDNASKKWGGGFEKRTKIKISHEGIKNIIWGLIMKLCMKLDFLKILHGFWIKIEIISIYLN